MYIVCGEQLYILSCVKDIQMEDIIIVLLVANKYTFNAQQKNIIIIL